jgi:hypothetical protein
MNPIIHSITNTLNIHKKLVLIKFAIYHKNVSQNLSYYNNIVI